MQLLMPTMRNSNTNVSFLGSAEEITRIWRNAESRLSVLYHKIELNTKI